MKKILIILLLLSVITFLGGLFLYQKWFALSDHLDYPTISYEESDDFNLTNIDEFEIYVRPVLSSPFIRCGFRKKLLSDHGVTRTQVIEFIIDIEKGKSVIQAQWNNSAEKLEYASSSSSRSWSLHPLWMNDELILFFTYYQYEPVKSILLPFRVHSTIFRGEQFINELWKVDNYGKLVQIQNFPFSFNVVPIPNSSTFFFAGNMEPDLQTPPFPHQAVKYEFRNNNFYPITRWEHKFNSPFFQDVLEKNIMNQSVFFVNYSSIQSTGFYVDDANQSFRIIDWSERAGSVDPNELFHYKFRTLTRTGVDTSLLYMENEKTVYEIDFDKLIDGTFEDTFKPILQNFEKYPWHVFDDDRVIMFTNPNTYQNDYAKPFNGYQTEEYPFAYYERMKNEDGMLGSFSSEWKTITVDQTPRMYCYNPLDDKHILYVSDGAIWSMKWDGTKHTKLFPKN